MSGLPRPPKPRGVPGISNMGESSHPISIDKMGDIGEDDQQPFSADGGGTTNEGARHVLAE